MLDPLTLSALLGLTQAGVSAVANAAANKATGNAERIRLLKEAQKAGQLTPEGQALAMAGRGAELEMAGQVKRDTEAALAMTGATSGRDLAAVSSAAQKRVGDINERAAERWQQAFLGEGQELEDRKAIRRDRTMQAVGQTMRGVSDAAASYGAYKGYTQKGPKGPPDYGALEAEFGAGAAAWAKNLADSGLSMDELRTLARAMGWEL